MRPNISNIWPTDLYKDFGPQFDVGNVHSRDTAIYVNISDKCPLNCHFCRDQIDDTYLSRNCSIMTTQIFQHAIEACVEHGVWYYSLMCLFGEPFMDRSIFDKIDILESNSGVRSYNIPSNFIPATRRTIDSLLDVKKGLLKISIYGADEQEYDAFTKTSGNFPKLLNNLQYLYEQLKSTKSELKVTIMMKHRVFDSNYPRGELYYMLRKLSLLPNVRIDSFEVYTSNRAITDEQMMAPNGGTIKKGICSSGTVGIIYPNGDVGYCYYCDVYRKHVMGNILSQSLADIYNNTNGPYHNLLKNMNKDIYNDVCSRCDFFSPIAEDHKSKLNLDE